MSQPFISGKSFVLFNPQEIEGTRTFCVLGSPRGGTSMAAGLLRLLGVFMGERVDDANNEDQDFIVHRGDRRIFREPEMANEKAACVQKFDEIITLRNRQHAAWGWKDPLSIFYIRDIEHKLINPIYIAIYRDSLSVAIGEHVKNAADPLNALGVITGSFVQITDFVRNTQAPVLCISYEKALQNEKELVIAFSKLVGTELSPRQVRTLSDYIAPNRPSGRITFRTAGSDVLRRIQALGSNLRSHEYFAGTISSLAIQQNHTHPQLDDYDQRWEHEKKLCTDMIAFFKERQYEPTEEHLGLMIAFYDQVFGITLYDTSEILDGKYDAGGLPRFLVHHHYYCGMVHLLHSKDLELALDHFRSAFALAHHYLEHGIGNTEEIGSYYLWASKYHEGMTYKFMGRTSEASTIKLFIASVYEATQHAEQSEETNTTAQYLKGNVYQAAMKELP